jgi:alpha-beta hydrolase superfamily lysophospholipase
MSDKGERLEKPSLLLLLAEIRAGLEFGLTLASVPALLAAPRGDGHPVLVLPGFLASDVSTRLLRGYLNYMNYRAYPWRLGRNATGVYETRRQVRAQVADIHAETGRTVSLVGWSLGGVLARDAALAEPGCVRSVITLGSPFARDITATNVSSLYERLTGEKASSADPAYLKALAGDLPVPATAIYSRTDGIVNWRTCMLEENDRAENIEIWGGSHSGLGVNAAAFWAIADRLSQPEGKFRRFDRGGPFKLFYPRPARTDET